MTNRLAWPILPKKCWPKIVFKEKRAVTSVEHEKIITHELHAGRPGELLR